MKLLVNCVLPIYFLSVSRHFRQKFNVYLLFLPELLFLLCLFGYLIFMIIYKWLAYGARDSSQAPSILIHFINMFVMQGKDIAPLYPGQVGRGLKHELKVVLFLVFFVNPVNTNAHLLQAGLQIFLVFIALLSVPVLLLGKPLYLYWTYRGGKGLHRCRVRAFTGHSAARPVLVLVVCSSNLRCCLAAGLREGEARQRGRQLRGSVLRRRRRGGT